jgi:hypothetical protein
LITIPLSQLTKWIEKVLQSWIFRSIKSPTNMMLRS